MIMNPPYGQKEKFVKRCHEITETKKQPFALLFPTETFQMVFMRNENYQMVVVEGSHKFTKLDKSQVRVVNPVWFLWNFPPLTFGKPLSLPIFHGSNHPYVCLHFS